MHECAHRTILPAQKSVHVNIKFVEPWFNKILLETFVPNFVSLTNPSLQILGKAQMGVFPIYEFLVNPL